MVEVEAFSLDSPAPFMRRIRMAASKRRSGFTLIEIISVWSSSASLPRCVPKNIVICRRNPKERPPSQAWLKHRPAYSSVSGNWYSGSSCDEARAVSALQNKTQYARTAATGLRFPARRMALTSAGGFAKRVDSTGFEDTGAVVSPQCGEYKP